MSINGYDPKYLRHSYVSKDTEDIVENYPNAFIPKLIDTQKNSHTCKDIEDLVENFANMVSETDTNAIRLGYKSDASKVDIIKYPKYKAIQNCGNCLMYKGKAGDESGPCHLFTGKQVSSKGWCSAYAKKV